MIPVNGISVAAFLKRNWEPCRFWPRAALVAWVAWYYDDARCGVVKRAGKIVAVGLVRRVAEADATERPAEYYHNENGAVAWVELLINKDRSGLAVLWAILLARCKGAKLVAWEREKNGNRTSIFPIDAMTRRVIN